MKVSAISPGMVVTDLLMNNVEPGREAQARRIFNILADRVETVTPWLADQMLANETRRRTHRMADHAENLLTRFSAGPVPPA